MRTEPSSWQQRKFTRARRGLRSVQWQQALALNSSFFSSFSAPFFAVCKLAKKGLTPSQIGVILRDSHGIAQVRSVTGNKILRLLKKNGAS